MTDAQWNQVVGVVRGDSVAAPPVGFIIDSPWLPNWFGIDIIDYFSSESLWFEANRTAIETFPEAIFFPGFWSEFGMCTEPSAFGAKSILYPNEFPFAEKLISNPDEICEVKEPNPSTDGLLPFMLNRLKILRPRIEDMGHRIRFSVSRGPLNIATFLMGMTEFLTALKTHPAAVHCLLQTITRFLANWHDLQRQTFPDIDGILVLDDIVGFLSEKDFREFGMPYLRELFSTGVAVKFFHNDAQCASSIRHYPEIGINLYNPGIYNTLQELRTFSSHRLAILGTIPPRDVLAQSTPQDVRSAVKNLLAETPDLSKLILSCAGGMPPGVPTENISAFLAEAKGE